MRHQGGLVGAAMNAELDHHLGYEKNEKRLSGIDNARNGRSSKTVKGDLVRLRFSCLATEIRALNLIAYELSSRPSTQERCVEVQHHLSGSSIKEGSRIITND